MSYQQQEETLLDKIIIGTLFVAFIVGMALMPDLVPVQHEAKYDCRIAEISPDFPKAVREACRKQNNGN